MPSLLVDFYLSVFGKIPHRHSYPGRPTPSCSHRRYPEFLSLPLLLLLSVARWWSLPFRLVGAPAHAAECSEAIDDQRGFSFRRQFNHAGASVTAAVF